MCNSVCVCFYENNYLYTCNIDTNNRKVALNTTLYLKNPKIEQLFKQHFEKHVWNSKKRKLKRKISKKFYCFFFFKLEEN